MVPESRRLASPLVAALVLCLTAGCGDGPAAEEDPPRAEAPSAVAADPSQAGADTAAAPAVAQTASGAATAAPAAAETAAIPVDDAPIPGGNGARITLDGQAYEFSAGSGNITRTALYRKPELELVTLETYAADNTLFAKVHVYVATGADPAGDYAAGLLADPEFAKQAGHGEITLGLEPAPGAGRQLYVSGSGRFTVRQQDGGYRVAFATGGDGGQRAKDAAPIVGVIVVNSPR